MKPGVWSLLRPAADGWELWKFQPGLPPAVQPNPPASALRSAPALTVALCTRDFLAVPLWLPAAGDPRELAGLELSSRHLLRRGQEVECVPLATDKNRSLVLAVATEEPSEAPPDLPPASRFEIAARTWPPDGADVVVWRESGTLCFAIYRGAECVYFSTGGPVLDPALCGAIKRTLLRLEAEGVLDRPPRLARLFGEFPEPDRRTLLEGLGFPLEYSPGPPPPRLPPTTADFPPPSIRNHRARRTRRIRTGRLALASLAGYALLATVFLGEIARQNWYVARLRTEAKQLAPEAAAARADITRWKFIRPAVDPGTFALDLLSAVAAQLPGDHVRLTRFSLDAGILSVTGEAREVAEAYTFIETMKSADALADFDWTASQPQLIGQQNVRFEMEGRMPDAQADPE